MWGFAKWEQHRAKMAHYFLLFATLALPLSGVIYTLSSARPIAVFGVPIVPHLVTEKIPALANFALGTHAILGKL